MKGKANGGQGGKLGHSNMDHWVFSEEHKTAARKQRRMDAKLEVAQGLGEHEDSLETKQQNQKPTMSFLDNLIKDPKYQSVAPRKPEEVADVDIVSPDSCNCPLSKFMPTFIA